MKSVIRNPKSAIIKITHVSCFEDKSKNISGIIRTIKKLSDIRQDFECIFIGDGIDKPKLEKYSADLGLNNKFIFYKGLLTGNDLANELSESDFLLMFSNYENMPVVINESLACGVPVISSNVGGIAEYLKPDFGLLVEPRNEDALLSAIIKMMDNYQNYDKNKLHDFAKNNFTYDIIGKQFLDIYKNSIN
jgi:glycosyltransferase involved in cell wall biosynthesis